MERQYMGDADISKLREPDDGDYGKVMAEFANSAPALAAEVKVLRARLEVAERAKAEVLRDYGTLHAEAARIEAQRDEARARVEALEAALQQIADEGDFTAPEGMKRIARDALLSAAPAAPGGCAFCGGPWTGNPRDCPDCGAIPAMAGEIRRNRAAAPEEGERHT